MMIIDRFGYKLDLVDKRGSWLLFKLKIIEHYFRIDLGLLLFDSLLFRR